MITYTQGDILAADVDAVVNTVNTVGVMGKGLALQFKRRYPENYKEYREACERDEVNLGRMFVTRTHEITGPRFIINFPTKGHWKANSKLSDISSGLQDLVRQIRELGISSVAVPPLGAGNGGLKWDAVRPVIAAALADLDDVNVIIFEPSNSHYSVRAAHARPMTRGRALLVELLLTYSRHRQETEPWETARGASHLEIQKLMYFASKALPQVGLRFEKGKYGPYSDVVRIMIQELEGTFLTGFGDGNDRVMDLTPVEVTDLGVEALNNFEPTSEDAAAIGRTVDSVVTLTRGFEGPYPLELLASVQWARDELGSDEPTLVANYVQNWTTRKGRLFTRDHIDAALSHLVA